MATFFNTLKKRALQSIFSLIFIMMLFSAISAQASAAGVIQNAFDKDQTKTFASYMNYCDWDLSLNNQDEWVSSVTGDSMQLSSEHQAALFSQYTESWKATKSYCYNTKTISLGNYSESAMGLVQFALDEVGSIGSVDSPKHFNKYTDFYNAHDAWCCMFVSYCASQVGLTADNCDSNHVGNLRLDWTTEHGIILENALCLTEFKYLTETMGCPYIRSQDMWDGTGEFEVQPGDIFVWYDASAPGRGTSPNAYTHIGIIEKFDKELGLLFTIEGNTISGQCEPITDDSGNIVNFNGNRLTSARGVCRHAFWRNYRYTGSITAYNMGFIVRPRYDLLSTALVEGSESS